MSNTLERGRWGN